MKILLSMVVIGILVCIAWIDHKTMKIPDGLNMALAVCGICMIVLEPEISIYERLAGAFIVSAPMYGMTRWIPESFGGGDIKLTCSMGLYLGWKMVLAGTFLGFLFGGCQAIWLLASGRAKAGEGAHMAFGPALCLGFFLAEVCGEELLAWYLQLFI